MPGPAPSRRRQRRRQLACTTGRPGTPGAAARRPAHGVERGLRRPRRLGSGAHPERRRRGRAPASPGAVVWFSRDRPPARQRGETPSLVVMQNAGLPEAGDAVLIFPPHVLDDAEAYARPPRCPAGGGREACSAKDAARSCDAGLPRAAGLSSFRPGFLQSRGARARRCALVWPRFDGPAGDVGKATVAAAAMGQLIDQLHALVGDLPGALGAASVVRCDSDIGGEPGVRMCGRLTTWHWPN